MVPDKKKNLFFSIIVPTYNRTEQLVVCLQSLAKLAYPRSRFEIIVIDDGSDVFLNTTIKPFQELVNLTLIRQQNCGPASARNSGAEAACGKFLAFTDDDCSPSEDWLTRLEARFETFPNCMFGGFTVNSLRQNIFSTTSQLIVDLVYDFYNQKPNQATFITSNNMAMPKALFDEIGGFDTSFPKAAAEDRDLCDRWLHSNYKIIYAPEVKVYHSHKLTFFGYWKQHFNYGRGACHYRRLRNQRGSGKSESIFGFHIRVLQLLRKPLAKLSLARATIICMLLFIWQVANAAGFFYEKFRNPEQL